MCPARDRERKECNNLYYGAQAKEDKVRYSSSSGGVFSILAQYIISQQGVVYGAGYDENMNVLHQEVETNECLDMIKRSKYVQSDTSRIYSSIEDHLKENRWVLFCGTPCQTQALRLYLNRNYVRLIVVDLVCYGVPSPGIWKAYVQYIEKKHNGKMTDFLFRDKRNSDNGHMRSYKIDGREYVDSIYEDVYCNMYFRNYSLRPSCYKCKFCTVNRESDFTIGDFWGIEKVKPEVDDGMGTSLVIAHSEQARIIWEEVKNELRWFECEERDVIQPRLVSTVDVVAGWRRVIFMLSLKILPFSMAARLIGK